MLSPIVLSPPRISFNLSQPTTSLPVFSAQPYKLPTLQKNSNHNHTNTNTSTKRFRCCSCGNRSSLHNFSRFQGHPDSEPSSSQSLSPSLLAYWLRSCLTVRDVKRLHSVLLKFLRDHDTYVFNNLVSVYIRFGKLKHARNVFDEMSLRNVVTWTAIINGYLRFGFDDEALSLFNDSIQNGVRPNANMFVCLLNLCSKLEDFELGRQLHAALAKGGPSNVIVESSVVKFYAQCGDLLSAFCQFDRTSKKDVVCWTTVVTACAQQGRASEAFSLFSRMLSEGFSPNEFTLCAALKACGGNNEESLRLGQALHGAVIKRLYKSDVFVGTSLVDMYAKSGRISDARSVFDRTRHRNTATWTSIISGYARRKGLGEEAVRLFRAMKTQKIFTNNLTIVSVVRACGSIRALQAGREVHGQIVRNSVETSFHLGSTLVWFYCRCGQHAAAGRVLATMPLRDVVSWTALISGCAGSSLGLETEALERLREMVEEGVEPNAFTYSSALKACAKLAAEAPGRLIHSSAKKAAASRSSVFVGSALIHMYARCGRVAEASRVFDEMPERNLVAWKSMVVGYARNGLCREALKLVYRMRAEGFEVDDYVLSEVLNACGGDVELGVERPAECELLSG